MNPLSAAYAAVAGARRTRYERHPEGRRRLERPVVSVGNLSAGGSGKTPAVAHIARLLLAAGEHPAILTRGYRRREPTDGVLVVSDGRRIRADVARAGDEPLMLARALPGVAVLVGADRYLSGVLAERRLGCSVHLLDDGFQHVRLHRDVDVVLLASADLNDRVLPAGRLREDVSALRRADAIVWSGGASAAAGVGGEDSRTAVQQTGVARVFEASVALGPLRTGLKPCSTGVLSNRDVAQDFSPVRAARAVAQDFSPVHTSLFAVAAIARPQRFVDLLAASGYQLAGRATFRDHHWYTRADLERVAAAARAAGGSMIVTTEKDLVRLLPFRPFPMPIVVAPLEFRVEPAAQFNDWLLARLEAARRTARKEQPA